MEPISVVIPCRRAEIFIEACIKSVLTQSYKAKEIIIVGDGVIDNTLKIASKFPVRIVEHPQNFGLATARNTGVKSAKSDVIAFLDVDCTADKGWLKNIAKNFEDKDIAAVGGRAFEVNKKGYANKYRGLQESQVSWDQRREVSVLRGMCSSYKKSALEAVNMFDPLFRSNGEDVDIGLRLSKKGYKIIYDSEIKVFHHKIDSFKSVLNGAKRSHMWGSIAFIKNTDRKLLWQAKSFAGLQLSFARDIIKFLKKGKFSYMPMVFLDFFMRDIGSFQAFRWYIKNYKLLV